MYQYRGLLSKVFEIRQKTKKYWFFCAQLAHNFEYDNCNLQNNFIQYSKGTMYIPIKYKELLKEDFSKGLSYIFMKEDRYFDETIEGLDNNKQFFDISITISKEEKEELDIILNSREDKRIYYLKEKHDSANIGTLWSFNNGYRWENICKPFPNLHNAVIRKRKHVGYNIHNTSKLAKIDYNKIKIE